MTILNRVGRAADTRIRESIASEAYAPNHYMLCCNSANTPTSCDSRETADPDSIRLPSDCFRLPSDFANLIQDQDDGLIRARQRLVTG